MSISNISLLRAILICALLVTGTLLGLAGTDLVLPALPTLPDSLGGDASTAQLVIAFYTAGIGIGLLLFGALSDRFDRRHLLVVSLAAFAVLSLACAIVSNLFSLIGLRFFQGLASAAPAVFAPGMIRALFSENAAVRAIGALGSIESLAPALAPVLGVWLLHRFGWPSTFWLTAILAAALALILLFAQRLLPAPHKEKTIGSYFTLLRDPTFLRYALSQAFSLGGMLVFVFGAPVVIVNSLGGELTDFIFMQIVGVSSFIIATNITGYFVERFGIEQVIFTGTCIAAVGALGLTVYALSGGRDPTMLIFLFVPLNAGFGLRGPPGFFRALVAARGDDDRGASLMVLAMMLTAAGGTALFAPFIDAGLPALAAAALLLELFALGALLTLPPWRDD